MKTRLVIISLLLLLSMLIACNKDDETVNAEQQIPLYTYKVVDTGTEDFYSDIDIISGSF